MERAVEWFLLITSLVVGVSHILHADAWIEAYRRLEDLDKPGAFANGFLSLVMGALVVAGHGAWSWPGGVLTAFGWLMVVKGAICFLAPDVGLRSMSKSPSRAGFMVGGVILLLVGVWAGFCLRFAA